MRDSQHRYLNIHPCQTTDPCLCDGGTLLQFPVNIPSKVLGPPPTVCDHRCVRTVTLPHPTPGPHSGYTATTRWAAEERVSRRIMTPPPDYGDCRLAVELSISAKFSQHSEKAPIRFLSVKALFSEYCKTFANFL